MIPVWPGSTQGNPHRLPLVFLHGFLGRGSDWLPVARRLANQHYCLMPDLPGHGANIGPQAEDALSFPSLGEAFDRFLSARHLKKVTLAGYSLGGRIALYLASRMPRRIRALILESAHPGLESPSERQARLKLDRTRAAQIRAEGMEPFIEAWYAMPLFRSLHRYPERLAEMKSTRKRNHPEWAARAIEAYSPGNQPPLWELLPTLDFPVLLLAGELDTRYRTVLSKAAERLPHSKMVVIPDAGHNAHFENPDAFAREVKEFLGDHFQS